jgi:hypothetical protein
VTPVLAEVQLASGEKAEGPYFISVGKSSSITRKKKSTSQKNN